MYWSSLSCDFQVWGCADSSIKEIQQKQRAWERKEVERLNNRKVNNLTVVIVIYQPNPLLLNYVLVNVHRYFIVIPLESVPA